MVKVRYRDNFNEGKNIKFVTILSFNAKNKNDFLPLIELSYKFFWYLLKQRLKGKIYLLITTNKTESSYTYDFIRIKKEKTWFVKFKNLINKF